jgi:hypothetical protein
MLVTADRHNIGSVLHRLLWGGFSGYFFTGGLQYRNINQISVLKAAATTIANGVTPAILPHYDSYGC